MRDYYRKYSLWVFLPMTATSHAFMCVHECVLGDALNCTWKQIYRKMTLLLHVQTIYNLTLLWCRSNSKIWRNNLFLKGRLGGHTIKCVLSSEHLKKTKLHLWVQKSWGTKTVWGTVLAYDIDEPCCLGRACVVVIVLTVCPLMSVNSLVPADVTPLL